MASTHTDDHAQPLTGKIDGSDEDDYGVTAVTDVLDGVDNDRDELHGIDTHR
jgi:hypothetical protein